ncbi:MAG: DUF4190 domain-containing protein [Microbacterium sp.]|uniref:DUF4190 domain-containing protein n=1 Tax=Microbacterium sp. TaxID=51671 RepID=UPI0039E2E571
MTNQPPPYPGGTPAQPPAQPVVPAPAYPPPAYGYPPYPAYPPPARTNVMAILSLVFAFVFPVLGVVFGHISLNQIKRTGEEGRGLALAGLILGYVFVGLVVVYIVFWIIWVFFIIGMVGASSGYSYYS